MAGMIAVARAQPAASRGLLNAGIQQSRQKTLVEALVEVADRPQLILDPAFLHPLVEFLQNFEGEIIFCHGLIGSFRSQHAALDGQMNSDRKSTRLNSSHLGISYAV